MAVLYRHKAELLARTQALPSAEADRGHYIGFR